MIPYTEFIKESRLCFERLFPDAKIQVNPVYKNNDLRLDSLSVFEKNQTVSPTIYLNHFYEIYQYTSDLEGTFHIMENFYRSHLKDLPPFPLDFLDFEKLKPRIGCRLLSVKRNRHLLEELPFLPFLDLAIVFFYLVSASDSGQASILITKKHLESWGISQKLLWESAMQTAPSAYPSLLMSLPDMLFELNASVSGAETELPLYVLTNEGKFYGASAMLYPDVLSDFSRKMQSDLYIIPSSIHEVLLLPVNAIGQQEQLDLLIQEVNKEQLAPEDILSDHAYYYSQSEKRILMHPPVSG